MIDVARDDAAESPAARDVGVWLVTDVYPPACGGSGWSTHALAQTLVAHGNMHLGELHITRQFQGKSGFNF